MKRAFVMLGLALALSGHAPAASAQAPKAAAIAAPAPLPPGWVARATPAPAATVPVPFGCDARAPTVCYFRIFYTRGDRVVILPAGMIEKKVPATVGGDYCMAPDKAPTVKCTRKAINDKYNS